MIAAVRLYVSLEARYLKPHFLRVLALAVAILSAIALNLAAPQFVRLFIDTAQEQGSIGTLYVAAGLFLAVSIFNELTLIGASYLGSDVAWWATNKMRSDLLLHVLNLDLSFHNSYTPGELIQRIAEDMNRLSNFVSQFVISLFGGVLLGIGVLVILALEHWRIGLAAYSFSVFYVVVPSVVPTTSLSSRTVASTPMGSLTTCLQPPLRCSVYGQAILMSGLISKLTKTTANETMNCRLFRSVFPLGP